MPASRAQRAKTAERRRQAIEMRLAGATLDYITEALGYSDRAAAHKDITRALEANVAELAQPVEVMRETELQRLDILWRAAWAVLKRQHVTVSHGRVVRDDNDETILDDGPVLQAIATLLRVQERRCKLLPLEAPIKVEAITIDAIDAEIARMSAEMEAEATDPVPSE